MISDPQIQRAIAAASLDEIAALNPRVQALRDTCSAVLWRGRGANALPRPSAAESIPSRELSRDEKLALPGMVAALRDYQTASRLGDDAYVSRFPALGNASGWRTRLVRWKPAKFNHARWYFRLKSVCDALDASEPDWRCKSPVQLHPLTEFARLVQMLLDRAHAEEWSQRQLAAQLGMSLRTWRRLKDAEAPFILDLNEWLPRLRNAAAPLQIHCNTKENSL